MAPIEETFLLLSLVHLEVQEDNQLAINLQQKVVERATKNKNSIEAALRSFIEHANIVKQFGRYPHRNQLLGRESTPEEVKFLAENANNSFMKSVQKR